VSNQLGVFGGAAVGGLVLAVGGFPPVGLCCLGGAVLAAAVVHLKVQDAAGQAPRAFQPETTATEEGVADAPGVARRGKEDL
jgi:hypothetical protein